VKLFHLPGGFRAENIRNRLQFSAFAVQGMALPAGVQKGKRSAMVFSPMMQLTTQ